MRDSGFPPFVHTKPFMLGTNKYLLIPRQETEEQFCIPSEALAYSSTIVDLAFGVKSK